MRPVEKVLERLEGVRPSNGSWVALCPAHEDKAPSLCITEGDDRRALVNCFAGCAAPDIVSAMGLEMKDLFERNGHGNVLRSYPPKTTATLQPCNLENYAAAKGLPVEFLQKQGLRDQKYQKRPAAVRIPYRGADGQEIAVRYRTALEAIS